MKHPIILASQSAIRRAVLESSHIEFTSIVSKIDEDKIKNSMVVEKRTHSDIALELAEKKAALVSGMHPQCLVIGCDQVLSFNGKLLSKAKSKSVAWNQLTRLRSNTHRLISSIVVYQNGKRDWHHIGRVTLTMHDFSDAYLRDYIARNWDSIQHSVGGYKIEEEGIRLFSKIEGSYFDILGLPLLELLAYLRGRGEIDR